MVGCVPGRAEGLVRSVNRAVMIVKARQPYIHWAKGVDAEAALSFHECRGDGSAFLVPEFEKEEDFRAFIKSNYRMIFEHELEAWMRDESVWPRKRSYRMFEDWFKIEIHDLVFDLGDDEIEIELL